MKQGFTYIMTNKRHTVLYIGVTSDISTRTVRHKVGYYPKAFTSRYNADKLVYFEIYPDIREAIAREKQLKAGSRSKKIQLIKKLNPEWNDLSIDLRKAIAEATRAKRVHSPTNTSHREALAPKRSRDDFRSKDSEEMSGAEV